VTTRLSDDQLLDKVIADFGLKIEGTNLERLIARFYSELDEKHLVFRPPCFLADEWFCPVGVPAIGIPFYLASTQFKKLEEKIILEVEGGTTAWFLKLMRHEAGHAYSYAYKLYKKKKWQKIFGLSSQEYPDKYQPRPYSHSYVLHLENWYAQSHPDEDFAETFAVWMTPGLNWRKKYRGWRALAKLQYVDRLLKDLAGLNPIHQPRFRPSEHSGLRIKLKTYYTRKKKSYAESYPDFYDNDLKNLFTDDQKESSDMKASKYLKINRIKILSSVAGWTNEKKYTINELVSNLTDRCKELDLSLRRDHASTDSNVAAFITTLVMNHRFTGTFKRLKHA